MGPDNPFRPPTSKGSFAPPSTGGGDDAAAAKRAAALAKLREMTQGKMLDDPRLAGPKGLGPADSLLGGPAGAPSQGEISPGLGMSAAALREARMKAEMLKAKQKQAQARRHPADDEDDEDDIEEYMEEPARAVEGAGGHPEARPARGGDVRAVGQPQGQDEGRPLASVDDEAHQWFKQAKMGAFLVKKGHRLWVWGLMCGFVFRSS